MRRRIEPDHGGALTNTGALDIGNFDISSSASVTAKSFVNSGTVNLTGTGRISPPSTCRERRPTTARFRSTRHRGARRSGRRHGVLQPLKRQSSVRLERFGRADHQRDRRGRAHAQAGAVLRRHDQRFRDRRHDRRDELSRPARDDVQFRREYCGHGRHAHADRHESESDRQYPDDRRLFEQEFQPRPRQRDRHAGEVRLSRRRRRAPCGHAAAIRVGTLRPPAPPRRARILLANRLGL